MQPLKIKAPYNILQIFIIMLFILQSYEKISI